MSYKRGPTPVLINERLLDLEYMVAYFRGPVSKVALHHDGALMKRYRGISFKHFTRSDLNKFVCRSTKGRSSCLLYTSSNLYHTDTGMIPLNGLSIFARQSSYRYMSSVMATASGPEAAKNFIAFVNASPTPFHAVQNASRMLDNAGFVKARLSYTRCQ